MRSSLLDHAERSVEPGSFQLQNDRMLKVDLRGTGLLSRLIADAGKAHGLPLPVEAVEVQVLCEACREARDD